MAICRVAVENLRDLLAPRFLVLGVNLFPFGSNSSWSRVELGDVEHGELVSLDEFACLLVMRCIFGGEAADNVSRQCHRRHLIFQKITHLVELLHRILPIHLVKHVVAATLNWNVQELINTGVLHDVSHCLQVLQNVRWVRHTKSQHRVVRHHFDDVFEQVGKVCADVASIGACVL